MIKVVQLKRSAWGTFMIRRLRSIRACLGDKPLLPPHLWFPIQIKERPLSHTAFEETTQDQKVQQNVIKSGWIFSAVTWQDLVVRMSKLKYHRGLN